ncbi:RNA polymerase sigma factor [Mucilaginibacter sp. OK098]|uniref:RNA polymerase sigma factor n=1 Tax=Mucilaginibacter sp. OK098 TaxID=1855297 RepID=UPI0009118943|nr:RNA polymerase sigma-70 factor [Mucilaginibacter sp. OK098]SHN21064.1 RNA polymerase sigma-70 factor, ECF subfamily [Mucilaginibacter sp. OK098]
MFIGEDDKVQDKLLLLKLKDGSTEAFDALYEKYWKEIYTAAFKRLQDPAQAKDITQDIFLQLWLKREENNIDNLPAYLFTATKNKVFNWMEKERRFTPVPELLLQLKTSRDQTDAELLRKEFMKAYEALIDTLTQSQQQIFRMRYQQDLSTSEIAELLDISRKTVQNQLGKAVAQLRASLLLVSLVILMNTI